MTRESSDIAALEERLSRLEEALREQQDLRAIEQLRYRYWYALLDKDVDEFVTCFTEDAFLEYGFDIELRGKEAIREFFANLLLAETLIRQVPRGANPQVTLVSENEARGRWLVEVSITRKQQELGTRVGIGPCAEAGFTGHGSCIDQDAVGQGLGAGVDGNDLPEKRVFTRLITHRDSPWDCDPGETPPPCREGAPSRQVDG